MHYISVHYISNTVDLLAAAQDDVRNMRDIEQFYNTQIEEMPMNVADLVTIPPSPSPSILNRGRWGEISFARTSESSIAWLCNATSRHKFRFSVWRGLVLVLEDFLVGDWGGLPLARFRHSPDISSAGRRSRRVAGKGPAGEAPLRGVRRAARRSERGPGSPGRRRAGHVWDEAALPARARGVGEEGARGLFGVPAQPAGRLPRRGQGACGLAGGGARFGGGFGAGLKLA